MSGSSSVHDEPNFKEGGFRPDPSEEKAWRNLRRSTPLSEDEKVENVVWDEPAHSPELTGGVPDGVLTYRTWLIKRQGETSWARSWTWTFLVAMAAGPWAILGAFYGSGQTVASILAITVFAPVVEETMKTAAALFIVEKKPHLFRSRLQIAICVLTAGFVFAAIENILYLSVYIADPTAQLALWRWTVCVALHMGCALIAGLGLMRIWSETTTRLTRPRLTLGFRYLFAAALLHGLYNGGAILLSVSDLGF